MLTFLLSLWTLGSSFVPQHNNNLLDSLLLNAPDSAIQAVLDKEINHNLQVIYTQINHKPGELPQLKTYHHLNPQASYYYPASLVKLPVAALALEKLRTLDNVDLNTTIIAWTNNNQPFFTNIGDAIEQMFVLSDNRCYTLLFDWLGKNHIEKRLREMGYNNSFILHSFTIRDSDKFKNIYFSENGIRMHETFPNNNTGRFKIPDNYLQWEQKDKTERIQTLNYMDLLDVHNMLISIIYPEVFQKYQRFNLSNEDYNFLRYYLGCFPHEADRRGDIEEHWDTYMKFFLNHKNRTPQSKSLRSFNKTGLSSGFLSDCAYFSDQNNNIEFFLSAAFYTNPKTVLSPKSQDYDDFAFPLIHSIFKLIYNYELEQRKGLGTPLKLPNSKSKY